jgi:hypothetical protein
MNRNTVRIASAVIAALACAAIAPVRGGAAYAATSRAVSNQPPSQAVVARKLAIDVTRARTPTARYNAVLAVMRTLHVGVVTGKGKALVPAGRPHNVYLYDFEVRVIAAAHGRGQTMTAEDIAGRLSAAGITPGGHPLTAARLARTLTAATRAAMARPRAQPSVVPLLARELGRRHRPAYDLATAASDKLQFDALQTFLIEADVAVAASRRGGATPGAAAAAKGLAGDEATSCFGTDVVKEFSPLGQMLIDLVPRASELLKKATVAGDMVHGEILAFAVAVTNVTPATQSTHYGPAGFHDGYPNAGQPLDLRVRVVMRDNYGDFVIGCGPLIGFKIPKKGPLPGIAVIWQDGPPIYPPPPVTTTDTRLSNFGTTTYPTGPRTDANGEALLHFVPNDEKVPGFGRVHHAASVTSVIALYQSAFGVVPGSVAQFLTPKSVTFNWDVSFHMPRGFKFAPMIKDNDGVQFDKPSGGISADMHVCGDNPFAPWTGTYTYVSEGDPLPFDAAWAFVPGAATSPITTYNGAAVPGLKGQLNLTPPFSVNFITRNFYGDGTSASSLPLEEDEADCLDNTPAGSSP